MQECIKNPKHNNTTTLILSNDEIEDIIKIDKSLEDYGLLLNGVSETIQNDTEEQKWGFYVTRYIRCKFIGKYFSR